MNSRRIIYLAVLFFSLIFLIAGNRIVRVADAETEFEGMKMIAGCIRKGKTSPLILKTNFL